jgi:hyperosmotically inducible protein
LYLPFDSCIFRTRVSRFFFIDLQTGLLNANHDGMNVTSIIKTSLIATALSLGLSWVSPAAAQSAPAKTDNTAVNKGDQDPGAITADQQKMNPKDRDLTSRIRSSIIADKSLSTYAHNVKIVSQDGTVTLKGPVRSDAEVKTIMAKATSVAGAGNVVNQMTVEPGAKP